MDLVFYNRLLRCYVIIDLKLDKLTHQDLGQMQMYVNHYDRHVKLPEENAAIGLLLCKDKKDAVVKLTLPKDANIHAREYQLYLPLESILAEPSVNGVSKGPTLDKSATEILRISAGTSRRDFYVNEDDFKHVDLPPKESDQFQLAPGDLLACRFNGNLHYVGRFSYYRGESGRVQVNPDKLIRFRIKTEFHCPRYVCFAMNAAPTCEAIEAMCATTAGNIGLSAGRLKTVAIPLPPLAEQRRIVAKVDQLMALVDEMEVQLAASRAAGANLLSAVVAELSGPRQP